MPKFTLPSHMGRKKLIKALQAEYRRLCTTLAPKLAMFPDPELRNVNTAQNVMRDALSAIFNEMAPYTHLSAVEMARRMASYCLSTVPMEDQEIVVAEMLDGFADFHLMRMAQGAFIASHWKMGDGRDQPNFPEEEN